jgi:hypothetical protein
MRQIPGIRLILKIALIAVLGLFGAVALLILGVTVYDWHDRRAFEKRSPITARSGATEFQNRVYARFPLGSPEVELIRELTAQGFRSSETAKTSRMLPEDALRSKTSRKSNGKIDGWMSLQSASALFPVCEYRWRVMWQKDRSQNISAIHAARDAWCL